MIGAGGAGRRHPAALRDRAIPTVVSRWCAAAGGRRRRRGAGRGYRARPEAAAGGAGAIAVADWRWRAAGTGGSAPSGFEATTTALRSGGRRDGSDNTTFGVGAAPPRKPRRGRRVPRLGGTAGGRRRPCPRPARRRGRTPTTRPSSSLGKSAATAGAAAAPSSGRRTTNRAATTSHQGGAPAARRRRAERRAQACGRRHDRHAAAQLGLLSHQERTENGTLTRGRRTRPATAARRCTSTALRRACRWRAGAATSAAAKASRLTSLSLMGCGLALDELAPLEGRLPHLTPRVDLSANLLGGGSPSKRRRSAARAHFTLAFRRDAVDTAQVPAPEPRLSF